MSATLLAAPAAGAARSEDNHHERSREACANARTPKCSMQQVVRAPTRRPLRRIRPEQTSLHCFAWDGAWRTHVLRPASEQELHASRIGCGRGIACGGHVPAELWRGGVLGARGRVLAHKLLQLRVCARSPALLLEGALQRSERLQPGHSGAHHDRVEGPASCERLSLPIGQGAPTTVRRWLPSAGAIRDAIKESIQQDLPPRKRDAAAEVCCWLTRSGFHWCGREELSTAGCNERPRTRAVGHRQARGLNRAECR